MKRILKGLLAASLGLVAVVGLVSCGETQQPTEQPTEKTETPAPVFDCANGVHDAATEWSSDNTKHWHACSLCDKLVDKEAHKWGEWTVTKEASLTEKGSRWHECSVCGKKLEEEIPMLEPESIVAAADTAIYVQVPADWETVNCYWWYKGEDGEYGSTTWPGEAMTQVDATNNIWGFVYPKGANMVIFNNGSSQTVDLKFKSTNYYILQAEATDKFDVEQYTTYTPAADQPELNKYATAMPTGPVEVESTTIYAQLPEAWTGHYIYYWGSQGTACPAWPGLELTVVDAAKHLYSAEVPADLGGFCLAEGVDAEGNTIDQTVDLALVEGVNAYIVQAVDGKDTAKLANYKDGTLTEIVVAIPLPDMNIKGSMNGWADNDAYKFTYDATTDKATFELTVAPGDAFKVAAVGAWSPQFNSQNSTLADGLKAGEGNDLENIVVEKGGKYLITISGCKDSATATCVFTVVEHQQVVVPVPELYVRGSFDAEWDALDAYKLVANAEAKQATLEVYLEKGTKFKVASADWGFEYKGSTVKSVPGLLAGDNDIEILVSGYYLFTVAGTDDKATATCTIELVAQDAVSTYKPADDTYGKVITEAGAVVDTMALLRVYIIVDAEGRIAYMCDMPKNGYGNPYTDSYARHSAYADYKTNPAFKDLSEPYKNSYDADVVDYKVVVPAGGFAITEIHGGSQPTTAFIELISGKAYAEGSVNTNTINVDNIRLSHKDGKITVTVLGGTEVKDLTVEGVKALTSDATVLVTGKVTKDESGYNAITDGTNVISFYNNYDHLHEGDEITVVAQFSGEYKNLQNFQLVAVTKKAVADTELELTKVTSVDQLVDGARVIIAYDKFAMGAQSGSKTRSAYPFADACVQVIKLVKSDNSWLLQVGEKEYLCLNSNNNEIHTGDSITDNAKWNIAITEGVLTITSVTFPEREIQYNKSSAFFRTYKGTQEDIELYVLADEEVSQSIVLNEVSEAVETFTDKAALNSITGYTSNFTFTDDVIVRINDDGNKISRLELNKNGAGVISFNATGKVTLTLTVKSTSGSNISAFAVSVNGQNIVANETAVAMECTKKDTTETEKAAGTLYAYTESETVIDSKGNEKAGATDENMYAVYGSDNLTVTFTIDASYVAGGAVVEIYSPASIQGRGVGVTGVTVETAE